MICCEKLRINGILTHEIGCTERWRGRGRECRWCGSDFNPENRYQDCCSTDCWQSYSGHLDTGLEEPEEIQDVQE